MKRLFYINSDRRGFTLLEILVASVIMTMIFTIVFGTFFYTLNNAENLEERTALYHRASYILNNISQSVESAFVPFAGAYLDEESEVSAFKGEGDSVDEFAADSLKMFTSNARFANEAGKISYVSYEVSRADEIGVAEWLKDEHNPLILICKAEPFLLAADDSEELDPRWSLNVRSVNFQYSDGSDWTDDWIYEDQGILPDAVKIEIELADSDGDTLAFSSIASVHVNAPMEQLPEELEELLEEEEAAEAEDEGEEEEESEGEDTEEDEDEGVDWEDGDDSDINPFDNTGTIFPDDNPFEGLL